MPIKTVKIGKMDELKYKVRMWDIETPNYCH